MSRYLYKDCKHYVEPTDYCERDQFDFEERVMLDCTNSDPDEEWMEECLLYEWNGEPR